MSIQNPFLNEPDRYVKFLDSYRDQYRQADPFPHAVLDDFLPEEIANQLHQLFPRPEQADWIKFSDPTGLKLATSSATQMPSEVREFLHYCNSAQMLDFLEELTGISGLIPDPWYEGGGLHQIPRGGFLKVHADFNYHKKLKLDRRINVLLYLNPEWDESYGGTLELWNQDMTEAVQSIFPIHNRCVIFNTTDEAFHGHPHPLTCPAGQTRKSIALYYYTNGRPEEEKSEAHTTLYQQTPLEAKQTKSLGYNARQVCCAAFDVAASIAYQPSKLLRRIADSLRPKT